MPKFMVIMHETPNRSRSRSPEEMQQVLEKYRAWIGGLIAADRVLSKDKLMEDGGKQMILEKGQLNVVNGPYSEAKEVVGGYITIQAQSYEEVIELCRDCPHLEYGKLEIRETDAMGCRGE